MSASACLLPGALRRSGIGLLKQQCWQWGCDVQRVVGGAACNALLEFGFTRRRPPAGQKGATMYLLTLPEGHTLVLWGFGVWIGDLNGNGIYLNRFEFDPCWLSGENIRASIHVSEQLASARPPQSPQECRQAFGLVIALGEWVADYEAWAVQTLGREFRQQCVDSYAEGGLALEDFGSAWTELAAACHAKALQRFGESPEIAPLVALPTTTPGRRLANLYLHRNALESLLRNSKFPA